jgi:hypothetical protein
MRMSGWYGVEELRIRLRSSKNPPDLRGNQADSVFTQVREPLLRESHIPVRPDGVEWVNTVLVMIVHM